MIDQTTVDDTYEAYATDVPAPDADRPVDYDDEERER